MFLWCFFLHFKNNMTPSKSLEALRSQTDLKRRHDTLTKTSRVTIRLMIRFAGRFIMKENWTSDSSLMCLFH